MSKNKQLPEFKTVDEETQFFETHSIAPYWEQLESVEVVASRPKKKQISIRFDPDILTSVQKIATIRGVPYQTLIQLWVAEKAAEHVRQE
ncbi:BrnA antitoxin family protein [Peptococcaceae bacterium]|nr:BrnA antitoxin family protein [Peptococcaceae bacterium]